MKVLILVAHGSRNQQSNETIKKLAHNLESVLEDFSRVHHAFLELAQPQLSEVIDTCVCEGADSLTLLPYFLLAGHHVSQEIPQIYHTKQEQYPHVSLELTAHLGQAPQLTQVLISLLQEHSTVSTNLH